MIGSLKPRMMMIQQEMIFIHRPGADNMTLNDRIKHIALRGRIQLVLKLASEKAIIAWYYDPNKLLNKQKI